MRLVFLTQAVDADHPALAQTLDASRALAERVDERRRPLRSRSGPHGPLPDNVRVRSFGGRARLERGARFERAARREPAAAVARGRCLAHMVPLFVVLAAPLAKPLASGSLLWYTHWHAEPRAARRDRASPTSC